MRTMQGMAPQDSDARLGRHNRILQSEAPCIVGVAAVLEVLGAVECDFIVTGKEY